MAMIQVTIDQLKAQATKLKEYNSSFKSQVTELEAVENNLNSMWEGDAKKAFHSAFTNDKTQMDVFYNTIEKFIATLNIITAKYQQAEISNTETARTRNYK